MKAFNMETDKIIAWTDRGMITILPAHQSIIFFCKKVLVNEKITEVHSLCIFNGNLVVM